MVYNTLYVANNDKTSTVDRDACNETAAKNLFGMLASVGFIHAFPFSHIHIELNQQNQPGGPPFFLSSFFHSGVTFHTRQNFLVG